MAETKNDKALRLLGEDRVQRAQRVDGFLVRGDSDDEKKIYLVSIYTVAGTNGMPLYGACTCKRYREHLEADKTPTLDVCSHVIAAATVAKQKYEIRKERRRKRAEQRGEDFDED